MLLRDEGDRLIIEPAATDPVAAVRGIAAGKGEPSHVARARLREEEALREDEVHRASKS